MPRGKTSAEREPARPGLNRPLTAEDAQHSPKLTAWFNTGDSTTEALDNWDIKQEAFCEAVLYVLSQGVALWLGTTADGSAVTITLKDGAFKPQRFYCRDSVELDDVIDRILKPKYASAKSNGQKHS